jgi:hypothetical protein
MAAYDFSNVSSADLLRLEWADEEERKRAANRVNTFAQLMGQRGDWSPTSGSDGVAALTAYSKSRDLDHLQQAQKMMSSALGTPALPYNDPAKFNTWYKTAQIPYRFVKDLRASYKNMSDQFRASEKHPGEMTLQERQIAAGEHQAALEAGEIESQQLGLEKERADLAAGKKREFNRGNEVITEVFKDGRWVFYSSAPRWDAKTDTTKQQDFRFYIDQVNEARKIEGEEPLTDREEADIFNKYFLKEQVETREAYTPSMVSDLGTKKVSFLNSRDISLNMLNLLGRSDVLTGGVQSFFGGLANISGQVKMMANLFREDDLINKAELYTWDKPELGDVLKANLLDLAYSLARSFEDEGGRLSKEDVQLQIDKLSAGMQSKTRMAAVLYDTHNRSLGRLKNQYLTAKDAGTPGTERSWEEYMAFIGTGTLLTRTRGDETGVGYWVDVIGPDGKAVVGEDGKRKREFIVFAKWAAGS